MSWLVALFFPFAALAAPHCDSTLFTKSKIEIKVIFGYKDARPARFVGDRHERLAFIDRIMAPCEGTNQACEFTRSRDDADLFVKPLSETQIVRLIVVNSSVGSDDEENRTDPFQEWKSQNAEREFLSGLHSSDVVFYNGHSRFGGGPDFEPPILAKNGDVSARAYKAEHRSFDRLLAALHNSKVKLIGLFSCSSTQHFGAKIHQASKAALIASPVLMYYSDALEDSLKALNSVLQKKCPAGAR